VCVWMWRSGFGLPLWIISHQIIDSLNIFPREIRPQTYTVNWIYSFRCTVQSSTSCKARKHPLVGACVDGACFPSLNTVDVVLNTLKITALKWLNNSATPKIL
jgi:hypothetical protein